MDKGILQRYSTWAKENLENQIEVSLKALGINDDNDIKKAKQVGDVTTIDGDPTSYPADLYGKRLNIIDLVSRNGYRNVIEEFAYTWFNRFVALRFMELHGFLSHGFRVLSDPSGGIEPEIMKNLNLVKDDLHLNMSLCSEYKRQGKIEELFRHVLISQCNVLAKILPMLFSTDMGYLELLLPKNLLKGETVITKLNEIPEESFMDDVEIIGWMYQFYISSKKDAVYASKKTITKDTLPAVTQLFTPDWIVRYMAQNSVGRLWLESYPDSMLRSEMKYYVEDAEQTEEVQKKIDEIKYKNVNPEEIKIIEPCCGSGHILVYVFDLLYKMYEERGYQSREIPTLILKNNLTGLDVDKRAAQLASFSLIMKARSVNNRFFNDQYYVTPHVYELKDSKVLKKMGYKKHLKDLNLLSDDEIALFDYIVDTFENGKTIGSLLKVKAIDFECLDSAIKKIKGTVSSLFNVEFLSVGVKRLEELSNLARILSSKYDVMITNPPYIGISSMEDAVKSYAVDFYPNSKSDMFAMFMETDYVKKNGYMSMINMHSWMFLQSYEMLRETILSNQSIINLLHLGPHAFEMISGEIVQTVAFVIRNVKLPLVSTFIRTVESDNAPEKEELFFNYDHRYTCDCEYFSLIPLSPISYWINKEYYSIFKSFDAIGDFGETKKGVLTGNDKKFVRLWFEISYSKFGKGIKDYNDMLKKNYKWIPATGGGTYRKWYGNFENVINMENDSYDIRYKNENNYRLRENIYYFRECSTWSEVSGRGLSMRYVPQGVLFGNSGPVCFWQKDIYYWMALLNSKPTMQFMRFLSPTLTFGPEQIKRVPCKLANKEAVNELSKECIDHTRTDWDSFETSWDFQMHPFLQIERSYAIDGGALAVKNVATYYGESPEVKGSVEACYLFWEAECKNRFDQLKANEEELNRIFIDIYGLQDELTPEVEDKDVTVRLADKERDVRSLISYLVGVAMGRYSLDVPGLAYAGGDWDPSKYVSYQPDDDGIIPIYTGIGMEDGLTTILIDLIKHIFGEDTYRANIDFIAEALGKNSHESSEETLNRYLNDGFYADHLKIYQKRPIYWLFTSGKKAGFKCLIYMHRYNADTLARINGKYFLPESTRKKNELDELNGRIAHSEGREKIRYEKERQNLAAAYNEAVEYGQVLDHMANQYISIDLDDGVKVNYAKFQGIELVTDGGSKVKKDLLSPLK